jgi:hypothetical protein
MRSRTGLGQIIVAGGLEKYRPQAPSFRGRKPEAIVTVYFFYIHDGRYSVPHFLAADAESDEKAIALATKYLRDSPDYISIDIVDDQREVAQVAR